jgi:hypothetical protein
MQGLERSSWPNPRWPGGTAIELTEQSALPAWILAYRYRGHPYRAIVHGQRAEVVFGRAPIDWSRGDQQASKEVHNNGRCCAPNAHSVEPAGARQSPPGS